jgi:hypothetical protein
VPHITKDLSRNQGNTWYETWKHITVSLARYTDNVGYFRITSDTLAAACYVNRQCAIQTAIHTAAKKPTITKRKTGRKGVRHKKVLLAFAVSVLLRARAASEDRW